MTKDFNKVAGEAYEALTKAALLLEGRSLQSRIVKFPEDCNLLGALNKVAYGGPLRGEDLGRLIYYIADIMENADNWQ